MRLLKKIGLGLLAIFGVIGGAIIMLGDLRYLVDDIRFLWGPLGLLVLCAMVVGYLKDRWEKRRLRE